MYRPSKILCLSLLLRYHKKSIIKMTMMMHTITPTTQPATIPPMPEEESPSPACLLLALLASDGVNIGVVGLLEITIVLLVDLMLEVITVVDVMLIDVTVVDDALLDITVVDTDNIVATSVDIVLVDSTSLGVLMAVVISILLDVISSLIDVLSVDVALVDVTTDVVFTGVALVTVTGITLLVITDCDGNANVVDDNDNVVDDNDIVVEIGESPVEQIGSNQKSEIKGTQQNGT